ncbi:hypothetical protein LJC41_08025, partial [Desulfosarcina sp. OttesenSCG-928-G17]|nr:hypothetical protein [Desulfosarcina sp. OttesenSCG-928-G17]
MRKQRCLDFLLKSVWLFLAVILALPASVNAQVTVGPTHRLTWGAGDLADTTLNQVTFSGAGPPAVATARSDLNDAITAYTQNPTPEKLTELQNKLTAYNTAITAAQGNTLGTITFPDSIPLTATNSTADQRLYVNTKAASFDIADGKTLTIAGNYFTDHGGAVSVAANGLFAVTGNGSIIFDNNAASGSSKHGGGIYNYGTVSFSGPATFTGNTASYGGGIENRGTVSFSGPATFTRNTASSGGGGIYNRGTLSFFGPVTFTNNSAPSNGGGIYNRSIVNFFGPATFTGNTAGSGGGIHNSDNGTVNLMPGKATDRILFSGNTTTANSTPSSIRMSASGTLNVGGLGSVDMRDPLDGQAWPGVISISKTGAGTWYLGGTNALTQSGTGITTFTISDGTLHLYRAGEVPNPGYADGKVATGTISL